MCFSDDEDEIISFYRNLFHYFYVVVVVDLCAYGLYKLIF